MKNLNTLSMNKLVFYLLIFLAGFVFQNCSPKRVETKSNINLNAEDFKTTINGKQTNLYFLKNGVITAAITNYGGRIVSLCVPDRTGKMGDIVLGFSSLDSYLKAKEVFHGALIGRVGNRIGKGKFTLDGQEYKLPLNNGVNHLHGGPGGFHNVVWDVKAVTDSSIVLTYLSPDGEMGYPGNLNAKVKYTLTSKSEMEIEYRATTDKSTPVNLTNHAFWNLTGEGNGTINNHVLNINANFYTTIDSTLIPFGENGTVEGTPFDFRKAKPIGQDLPLQNKHEQLHNGKGYDHNFVLNRTAPEILSWAATVIDPSSGREMVIFTEEPGLQFYGGNFMDGTDIGKSGRPYNYRESFALETQHSPDSPNQMRFPSVILNPGKVYQTKTVYRFRLVL